MNWIRRLRDKDFTSPVVVGVFQYSVLFKCKLLLLFLLLLVLPIVNSPLIIYSP